MATVTLRPGRERSVVNRHPWLFSGALAGVDGRPAAGEAVEVVDHAGGWLARGTWGGSDQLAVRLWTWEPAEAIDAGLIRRRLARSIAGRAALTADPATTAYRLVFSEADGLPGLVIDRYGDYLAAQLSTAGAAARADEIVAALVEALAPRGIVERGDGEVRVREGLPAADRLLLGRGAGRAGRDPRARPAAAGRPDRRPEDRRLPRPARQPPARRRLLPGGRGAVGLLLHRRLRAPGGAGRRRQHHRHRQLGRGAAAGRAQPALNEIATPIEWVEGNVFGELRRLRAEERRFDVVILDPPKFVQARAQLERGCRGYKDINLLAMQLLRPGGVLATFSCSGLVSADLFQKVVFGAAVDARRDVQIVERLGQGADHPVLLTFPESEYLKGLVCRVW